MTIKREKNLQSRKKKKKRKKRKKEKNQKKLRKMLKIKVRNKIMEKYSWMIKK